MTLKTKSISLTEDIEVSDGSHILVAGQGIGLFMVHKLVNHFNGKIEV
ncbi:hypothetical protein [Desertibacillus haloalkaliphilus]|nr:hypothetical protein [Desertibacillus haloalkaliphilus]MBU8906837.1 hypothetical protein [Desertibacillus haloalkaliphilus]